MRRPAPRWSAAFPTAIAPSRITVPDRGASTTPTTRCLRERVLVRGASLGFDPASPGGLGGAARDRRVRAPPPLGLVDPEIGEREQACARIGDELREVGRALAANGRERLAHLERVADGGPERLVHVGEKAHDLAPGLLAEGEHRIREPPRFVERLHEGTVTDLDVEHDRLRAARRASST